MKVFNKQVCGISLALKSVLEINNVKVKKVYLNLQQKIMLLVMLI